MAKTYYCIKSFSVFEQGAQYYCFAVKGSKHYFCVPYNFYGFDQIILDKNTVKKYFKIL